MNNILMKKITYFLLTLVIFGFSGTLTAQVNSVSEEEYKAEIENFRVQKDLQLKEGDSSPLSDEQIENFQGLSYFPIDFKYSLSAQFVPDEQQREISLTSSDGNKINLVKHGTVNFELDGKSYSLTVFRNNNLPEMGSDKNQLFIPFSDNSTGSETNTEGRYLLIDSVEEEGSINLDFNKAMNPYSAYNSSYISIIPPAENSLSTVVATGERKYEDR
jgi:uncharacterized protein (DUF1684 family)